MFGYVTASLKELDEDAKKGLVRQIIIAMPFDMHRYR